MSILSEGEDTLSVDGLLPGDERVGKTKENPVWEKVF